MSIKEILLLYCSQIHQLHNNLLLPKQHLIQRLKKNSDSFYTYLTTLDILIAALQEAQQVHQELILPPIHQQQPLYRLLHQTLAALMVVLVG